MLSAFRTAGGSLAVKHCQDSPPGSLADVSGFHEAVRADDQAVGSRLVGMFDRKEVG
jgi:hypothetical protein